MWKLISMALLCAAASTANAEMYKWIDAEGHVQFSDKKPEKITKSVESMAMPTAQVINGRVSTSQNVKSKEENKPNNTEINAEKDSRDDRQNRETKNR